MKEDGSERPLAEHLDRGGKKPIQMHSTSIEHGFKQQPIGAPQSTLIERGRTWVHTVAI